MIGRYTRPEMRDIWTEERKLEIWLEIELLAAEALCGEGLVPKKHLRQMKDNASFNIKRCRELERTLNHDVIAFTTNVGENIGKPASRWLHFGLTSSDIIDTAFAVQMNESLKVLITDVKRLRQVIATKARKYKFTPMIGRSHGINAEPTTFGLKMALMYDEFGRALERLETLKPRIAIGKLSGAVGTNAHLSPKVELFVCRKLGLKPAPIATQVVQRDIHAELMTTVALVGASIERWPQNFGTFSAPKCSRPRSSLPRAKKARAPCRISVTPSPASASPAWPACCEAMPSPRSRMSLFGTSATSATAPSSE